MKTSELTGVALDWAVARCEGVVCSYGDAIDIGFINEGGYTPSTDWAQGGAIIERECIGIDTRAALRSKEAQWEAHMDHPNGDRDMVEADGPTPLIAAMRCYVASKLGDEVEIPEELTQGESK